MLAFERSAGAPGLFLQLLTFVTVWPTGSAKTRSLWTRQDQIFMDVDTIEPGVNFAEEIDRAVAACKVLLAFIGPNWLTATDARGRWRIDDPHDFVRLEIGAALAFGVRVIPLVTQDAVMPGSNDLPEILASLARRNALLIRHESFGTDVGRLIAVIERVLAAPPGSAAGPAAEDSGPA